VYYSAQVFFFGAELTRIFATTHGGGIVPVHRSLGPRLWRRPRLPSAAGDDADAAHEPLPTRGGT